MDAKEVELLTQEQHEDGAHAAMGWPPESERPEIDPQAQKEIDELWTQLHGQEQEKEMNTEEETS